MRKRLLSAMVLTLAMGFAGPAHAASDIAVTVNGNPLTFDVPPQIVEGRTMVPMRAIFEEFGMVVDWNGSDQSIYARNGETFITMQIGNKETTKNGVKETNDVAPMVLNGRTMVPLRYIADALDMSPEWNGDTRTVEIATEDDSYKAYRAWYEVDKNGRLKVCTNVDISKWNDMGVYYIIEGTKYATAGSGELIHNAQYASFYAGGYLEPGNNWKGMDCYIFTSGDALQEYYRLLQQSGNGGYDEAAKKLGNRFYTILHINQMIPVVAGTNTIPLKDLTYRQDNHGWGEEYALTLQNPIQPKGEYFLSMESNKTSRVYQYYNRLWLENGKMVTLERINYFADGMAKGAFRVANTYAQKDGNGIKLVVDYGDKTITAKAIENGDLQSEYPHHRIY